MEYIAQASAPISSSPVSLIDRLLHWS